MILCDSDVLIEVFDRNNQKLIQQLLGYDANRLCVSSITYSEIIFGSTNKKHQKDLLNYLDKFILLEVNQQIDMIHRKLVLDHSLSHKLRIQDALIAASALRYDIPLYTLNKRDFSFIKELVLI